MTESEREDWTLRWADQRPFGADAEAEHFPIGLRGRAKAVLPNLGGWLDYGERIEAIGSGRWTGKDNYAFFAATDRGLVVLVVTKKYPIGHPEHLIDSMRIPYGDIVEWRWSRRGLPLFPKLGYLWLRAKDGRKAGLIAVMRKPADALGEAFERHMPTEAKRL
jgi:hypothetical protein